MEKDVLGSDFEFSGTSSIFIAQIGYALSDNLIVFGKLGDFVVPDPDIEWGGGSATTDDVSTIH